MAEPTLNLVLGNIQAKLGTFAGWGRGTKSVDTQGNHDTDPAWTNYQQAVVDDAVQSGLRRFYYPTVVEGQAEPYEWAFLRPTKSFSLAKNATTIPFPSVFGGVEGPMTCLTTGTTAMPWKIEWTNQGRIRQMFSTTPTMTGPPMYVALDPLDGTTGNASQQWQLLVFPIADQAYTLQGTCFVNPDYLTGAAPYAYGGPEHTETILESCLAVMEERLDDMSGVHRAAFQERLIASISMDRKKKPQKYGPNLDHSDGRAWSFGDIHWWAPAATYNGQPFGS